MDWPLISLLIAMVVAIVVAILRFVPVKVVNGTGDAMATSRDLKSLELEVIELQTEVKRLRRDSLDAIDRISRTEMNISHVERDIKRMDDA